jgi:hypothetical protein
MSLPLHGLSLQKANCMIVDPLYTDPFEDPLAGAI